MPKFIIDQAIALRTVVEVEADNYKDFLMKYKRGEYQDKISHAQMEWNVEDTDEEVFDGSWEDYHCTILNKTSCLINRGLGLERWNEEYKREFLKTKLI